MAKATIVFTIEEVKEAIGIIEYHLFGDVPSSNFTLMESEKVINIIVKYLFGVVDFYIDSRTLEQDDFYREIIEKIHFLNSEFDKIKYLLPKGKIDSIDLTVNGQVIVMVDLFFPRINNVEKQNDNI